MMRLVLGFLFSCLLFTSAWAQERITNYDVKIEVEKSGGLMVTETINVISEGREIRRGIFREMPRYYKFTGVKLENDYNVISIKRDGNRKIIPALKMAMPSHGVSEIEMYFLIPGHINMKLNTTLMNKCGVIEMIKMELIETRFIGTQQAVIGIFRLKKLQPQSFFRKVQKL